MWKKPWKLTEGFLIGGGLIVVGLLLQLVAGPIDWSTFAYPVNVCVLALFLFIVVLIFVLRRKVYAFRYLGTFTAAVPALAFAVVLTAIMGLTRQHSSPAMSAVDGGSLPNAIGITHMLSFWPFVLVYVWIVVILGQAILKRLVHLHKGRDLWLRDVPFLLNHLGLFVTIVTATLGNADMQRLKMIIGSDNPEWRAVDDKGMMHELPLAILIDDFRIDEYAPKIVLVDNHTGSPVGGQQAEILQLDSTFTEGQLGNWLIRLHQLLDYAAPVMNQDSVYYQPWQQTGAVTAARVEVEWHPVDAERREPVRKSGWLTCGNYMFPQQTLMIDSRVSLAMMPREPQRYVSRVEILSKSGKHLKTNIMVNKPFSIDGWKIYQLDYDVQKGRWSEVSVLELVSDPWLPYVYGGIIMMLLGAVAMFVLAQRRREEENGIPERKRRKDRYDDLE